MTTTAYSDVNARQVAAAVVVYSNSVLECVFLLNFWWFLDPAKGVLYTTKLR
jgi:hypothetical protein